MSNIEKYLTNGEWTYDGFLQWLAENWSWGLSFKPIYDLLTRNPDVTSPYFVEQFERFTTPDGLGTAPYIGLLYQENMFNVPVVTVINGVASDPSTTWNVDMGWDNRPVWKFNGLDGHNPEDYKKIYYGGYELLTLDEYLDEDLDFIRNIKSFEWFEKDTAQHRTRNLLIGSD